MTPAARHRLQIEFDRADYRKRIGKRVLIVLGVIGFLFLIMSAITNG